MNTNTKTDEKTDAKLDKLIGKVAEATREADLPSQWCLDNQNRLVRFASALLAADRALKGIREAQPADTQDIHSCSYYCNRPECIKAQRDELVKQVQYLSKELAEL